MGGNNSVLLLNTLYCAAAAKYKPQAHLEKKAFSFHQDARYSASCLTAHHLH